MAEELLGIDTVKNDQIRDKNKRAEGTLVFIFYLWRWGHRSPVSKQNHIESTILSKA